MPPLPPRLQLQRLGIGALHVDVRDRLLACSAAHITISYDCRSACLLPAHPSLICRQGLVHEVKHSSVDDVYERVKEIGHGMTGRVYQVKHRLTGEVYALKCESAVTSQQSLQEQQLEQRDAGR